MRAYGFFTEPALERESERRDPDLEIARLREELRRAEAEIERLRAELGSAKTRR